MRLLKRSRIAIRGPRTTASAAGSEATTMAWAAAGDMAQASQLSARAKARRRRQTLRMGALYCGPGKLAQGEIGPPGQGWGQKEKPVRTPRFVNPALCRARSAFDM